MGFEETLQNIPLALRKCDGLFDAPPPSQADPSDADDGDGGDREGGGEEDDANPEPIDAAADGDADAQDDMEDDDGATSHTNTTSQMRRRLDEGEGIAVDHSLVEWLTQALSEHREDVSHDLKTACESVTTRLCARQIAKYSSNIREAYMLCTSLLVQSLDFMSVTGFLALATMDSGVGEEVDVMGAEAKPSKKAKHDLVSGVCV